MPRTTPGPFILVIVLLILGLGYYFLYGKNSAPSTPPVTITTFDECAAAGYPIAESYPRQCRTPDGNMFVEDISNDDKVFTDPVTGATYRYPGSFLTKYISETDWPPAVQLVDGPFSCTDAGTTTARAGRTENRTINGRTYCVTIVSEGAAGSVYNQYAYAFPAGDTNNQVAILTFTTRAVQCDNYNEPERQECKDERVAFNLDEIIDGIAQTFRLK